MSQSLYRKYRPKTFEDVVGQDHIVKTLQNSITSNNISHAYLFCGPRGTGKTTTARILAKALLCDKGTSDSPDGTCESCELIAASAHPDVSELDAASRTGVDNVREEIISRINFAPTRGNYKVYIIDEVHMLSTAAFNALLKTLEEPPDHVVFILCTTDPQKVPDTIHSRCQRFDFRPISVDVLVGRLGAVCEMENVDFEGEEEALDIIARRSNGGLRDALTTLEQVIAFGGGKRVSREVTEELLGKVDSSSLGEIIVALRDRDVKSAFEFLDRFLESGGDLALFIDDLANCFRDIYVLKLTNCNVALQTSEMNSTELTEIADGFTTERLCFILSVFSEMSDNIRRSQNMRLSFELLICRLAGASDEVSLESLSERVAALESGSIPSQSVSVPQPQTESSPLRVAPAPKMRSGSLAPSSNIQPSPSPKETSPAVDRSPTQNTAVVPPTSQAAPVQATTSEGANKFADVWRDVIADMKITAPSYGSILMNSTARYDAAKNIVTIVFPSNAGFTFNNAQKPACRTAITTALEKKGLSGFSIEVTKEDGTMPAPVATANVAKPATVAQSSVARPAPVATPNVERRAPVATPNHTNPAPVAPANVAPAQPVNAAAATPSATMSDANTTKAAPANAESAVDEASDVDNLQNILSSAFGDGAHFREVE